MFVQQIMAGGDLAVVDVGAANGLPRSFLHLASQVNLFLFEPNPAACEQLQKRYAPLGEHCRVLPYALSGSGGRRTLRVTNKPTGSSLLEIDARIVADYSEEDYFYPIVERDVDTRTLACVMDEQGQKQVDMIKLDTQGTELEILSGLGPDRLSRLTSVEIEIGAPGCYKGQPQLYEVQAFLERQGLVLFDLMLSRIQRPYHGDSEYYTKKVFDGDSNTIASRLIEVDAIFLRDPHPLLDAGDVPGLRRLMVAYCAYRFFPEAYALAGTVQGRGLIDDEAAAKLRYHIKQWHALLKQSGG